jgi:hypothetical protein
MKKNLKSILKIALFLDFLITFGFGLVSWIFPYETFGTIVVIPENGNEIFLSLLSNHSISYILVGLICLIGVKSNFPINIWIGLVMLLRHLLVNILGIININKDWIIGNPYHDIIIHSLFILAYMFGIILTFRQNKNVVHTI